MTKLRSAVLWLVLYTQIWTPVLAQTLPIAVDKSAGGQRPVVGVANGVPIVNIAPPSAGGISDNRFNQFNVGPSGVVLNNSGGTSQTQLAGQIAGNPMLGNQHAMTILNQVTGGNPSQLMGVLEVAGNRAGVIVANPAGITCNGCGFLNANRATLTTGRPVVGPNGLAFEVTGGHLAIEGAGLYGSNLSQVDLLARTMAVNARVWADRLNVVAGAAHVGYDGVTSAPIAGQGPAPRVALDTAALGGMYANSIRLIGTEAGLGVNMGGNLSALTGDLQVSANGDVRILPSARVQAARNLTLQSAGQVVNSGAMVSGGATAVQAQGLRNAGTLVAGGDARVVAETMSLSGGRLAAGGALQVSSRGAVRNQGGALYGQSVDLSATSLDNTGGKLTSGGTLTAKVAGATNNTGGTLASKGSLALQAQSLVNRDGVVSGESVTLATPAGIDNQHGAIQANHGLTVDVGALNNQGGKLLAGSADVKASTLDNRQGVVQAGGHLALRSAGAVHNQGGGLYAGSATIRAADLDNKGGKVVSAGALDLQADKHLDNAGGTVAARGQANIQAQRVTNARGLVAASGLSLKSLGAIDNSSGLIQADGKLHLNAASLANRDTAAPGISGAPSAAGTASGKGALGVIGGQIAVQIGTLDNQGGRIAAVQDLALTTPKLENTGKIQSRGDLKITTDSLINRAGGEIVAVKNTVLNVAGALTNAGLIDGGYTRIDAGSVANTGRIYGDRIGIKTSTLVNDAKAVIASRGDMDLGVGKLTNREHGLIYAGGNLRVGGSLDAAGKAVGQAQLLANESATIEVAGKADIAAASIQNRNLHFASKEEVVTSGKKLYYRLKNSTKLMDGSKLWLCDQVSTVCGRDPDEFLDDDHEHRLLLPSTKYPESRYGPPFDYVVGVKGKAGDSAPIPPAWMPRKYVCDGSGASCSWVEGGPRYKAGDRVWKVFGVAEPVAVPPMVEYECGKGKTCHKSTPEREQALALNKARHDELDRKVHEFNADFNDRLVDDFFYYKVTEVTRESRTVSTDPAKIIVGGNATLTGAVVNDKSRIVAGGTLKIAGPVKNIGATGERVIERTGTETRTEVDGRHRKEESNDYHDVVAPERIELAVGSTTGNTAVPATGNQKPGVSTPSLPPARVLEIGMPGGLLVRVVQLEPSLPQSAMFQVVARPDAPTLIATDGQFLRGRQYASSDLLLQSLNADRGHILKRLGDGFYEQRLVAEQIMLATGRRFVGDYTDNEAQYKALLKAGAEFARKFHLTIGTALSEAQMRHLTADVVWLEKQTITLPDGTTQQVLVPRVYLAVKAGDLRGDGTLIAGRDLQIKTEGDVANSGTLAARSALVVDAQNIQNTGGSVRAKTVNLAARNDIDNVAGLLKGDNVALAAGRDINLKATTRSGGNEKVSSTHIDGVARIEADRLSLRAGRDVNAQAAAVSAKDDARIQAGNDINLGTARERYAESHDYDERNHARASSSTEVGTQISGGGNVTLIAGRDVNARAAQVSADKQLAVGAGRDVNITAGQDEHHTDNETYTKHHGFMSTTTTERKSRDNWTESASSTLTGDRTVIMARRDVTIAGSDVAAQKDVVVSGERNVTITSVQNKSDSYQYEKVKKSGFGALGGISYGSRQTTQSTDTKRGMGTASTVGSVEGNVLVNAGGSLKVKGSEVLARQGDITMIGRDVKVENGVETLRQREEQETKQSGLTVTASNPIVDALQTGARMAEAAKKVDNPVMKGLAAGTTALAASNGYDAVQAAKLANGSTNLSKAGGVSVKLSLGSSQSRSVTERSSTTAVGSTVAAGKDLTIIAKGAGQASGITVTGSTLSAGHNAILKADGDILLQAGKNVTDEKTNNSSHGASVGIGFNAGGTQNGFTLELGANASRGKQEGHGRTWTNTHVTAGNVLAMQSGGDTTLKGASAKAERILASVGGNLRVESQQDSNKYKASQKSGGIGVSLCVPPYCYGSSSVSGNIDHGKTNSNWKSVSEQTGLHAGNGGFQIDVKKNTALVGGVIASSDRAVAEGRNRLSTGTLTTEDIKNKARYDANQIALGAGIGIGGNKTDSGTGLGTTKDNKVAGGASKVAGSSIPSAGGLGVNTPVVMAASGKGESTTRSAISGGTIVIRDEAGQKAATGKTAAQAIASLNRDTKDTQNSLKPIFDKEKVEAGFVIGSEASRQTGQFLANRAAEADALKAAMDAEKDPARRKQLEAQHAEAAKWGVNGSYGRALTVITAATGGNVTGSTGQMVRAAAATYIQGLGAAQMKQVADLLDSETARAALQGLVGCAGAAAQGASCSAGARGAAASVVLNNLLENLTGKNAQGLTVEQKQARSNLVAGLVAGLTTALGGDSHVAALAAKVETDNNYLGQKGKGFRASEQKQFDAAMSACSGGNAAGCARAKQLGGLSEQRNQELVAACSSAGSSLCQAAIKLATESGNVVFFDKQGKAIAVPADSPMIQATKDPRDGSWHYKIAASVAEGLALDAGGGALEGVGSKLLGLLRPKAGEAAATAVRNGEVLSADGKVLARQNPITGEYEPVTSRLSDGTKGDSKIPASSLAARHDLQQALREAQKADHRIGATLPGAKAPITVTAESNIGGKTLFDTNQTARPAALADPKRPTLIADLVRPGSPNSTMANAHAEIGLIQQAFDAGLTKGKDMKIVVRGEGVCGYCMANIKQAAERSGLNRLEVIDTAKGVIREWVRGKGWVHDGF